MFHCNGCSVRSTNQIHFAESPLALCSAIWIHRTVRIPCLTVVDPNREVPDLYFKVVDPKLQVANLKSEVGELRSCGIPPNLTTAGCTKVKLFQVGQYARTRCTHDSVVPVRFGVSEKAQPAVFEIDSHIQYHIYHVCSGEKRGCKHIPVQSAVPATLPFPS